MLIREGSSAKSLIVVSVLLSLLVFMSNTSFSQATVVWSDNFDDGDYMGWTVTQGSYSVIENVARADVYHSCIHHPSMVSVGTWSCDVYVSGDGASGAHVCFYCEGFVIAPTTGYELKVYPYSFELMLWFEYSELLLGTYHPTPWPRGWQHVDVTRDATGLVRVFVNGSLCIEAEQTPTIAANYFHFFCGPGEALDNVLVSDSVDITPTTDGDSDGFPTPLNLGVQIAILAIGIGLVVALVVLIWLRKTARYK